MSNEREKNPSKNDQDPAEQQGQGAERMSELNRGRPSEMTDALAGGELSPGDQDPPNPERAGFVAVHADPRMTSSRESDELPEVERDLAEEAAAQDATDDWHIKNKSQLEKEPGQP